MESDRPEGAPWGVRLWYVPLSLLYVHASPFESVLN